MSAVSRSGTLHNNSGRYSKKRRLLEWVDEAGRIVARNPVFPPHGNQSIELF